MSCNCNNRKYPNNWRIKDCDDNLLDNQDECEEKECNCCCHHHHHHHHECCDHTDKCNCNCVVTPVSQSRVGEMENCCDFEGGCGVFKTCCRNRFWPEFAHPRFLCCRDLYTDC